MKTKIFSLFLMLTLSIGTIIASDTQVDGIWYNFDNSTLTAVVTYRGASYSEYSNEYVGAITIPVSVNYNNITYSVTGIGELAFNNCNSLTSIEIPNSVTSIGLYAFYGCTGLTSIEIPTNVTRIGEDAFYNCNNITSIVWSAKDCNGYNFGAQVESFIFGDSVERIPASLCYGMSKLTSIIIPNSVISIGEYAFIGCTGLTSIEIPKDITNIGQSAFYKCDNITSVVWNAKNSNSYNFGAQVESFVFGDSVEIIPASLCSGMSKLTFITLPQCVTSIGEKAFYHCSGLTSVEIPNKVTSIGNYAFADCRGLTSIEIPNGVTSIGSCAFYGCIGLTSVTIPNSITSIGSSAFYGCAGLTSIEIPNGVTSIGDSAFRECTSLTSVEIPNSVLSIGEAAFHSCTGLTSITIPNSITSIENYTFAGCSGLTSIKIPNSITSIGDDAFGGCSNLTSIEIPNNVTSIGSRLFSGCTNLTSVTWNVKNCGNFTYNNTPFYYSSNPVLLNFDIRSQITSLTFGEEVEHIPACLCNGMQNLSSMTIQNNVTSIGYRAFNGCSGLSSITCEAETPPSLGNDVFTNTNNCFIYVPCGSLDAYKAATNWSNYASQLQYVPLAYTITIQPTEHGNVETPESICDLPLVATPDFGCHFVQWSDGNTDNPRTIELTQDTTFAAEFAIDKSGTCGANNMLSWVYDDQQKVLTISGNGTLDNNYTYGIEAPSQMKTLVIGNEIPVIGDSAFYNSNRLMKIFLGETIVTIGNNAFRKCPYILEIHAPMEFPPVIDASVFAECGNLSGIDCYVSAEFLPLYKKANIWSSLNLLVEQGPTTIDNTTADQPKATKILQGDKILILRGEKVYTVTGQEVR